MSSLINRQHLYVGNFLMLLCFGLLQLSAQELQQGQSIDVEEYEVEAELMPSSQELWVKATIRFNARERYLSQVVLDFNGNLMKFNEILILGYGSAWFCTLNKNPASKPAQTRLKSRFLSKS